MLERYLDYRLGTLTDVMEVGYSVFVRFLSATIYLAL